MRKQGVIYLGLFIMVFGLYAAQLKKNSAVKNTKISMMVPEDEEVKIAQTRIQLLYDQVFEASVFKNKVSGVSLKPMSPPVKNDFTISFSGDEIYTGGDFSIHESWGTVLDFLAGVIKSAPGLEVEVSGFANENDPREKSPTDYGSSPFAFSFARAEWLAHYFERKHGLVIKKTFVLRGMGAIPQGKRIDLRFHF
jgi:outer membrane protein OmpA-like peptidoglycan-associated protein